MARDKLEEARREGMAYALKIVKTKGIEGLEEECKFRGATKMPLALPKNAIDECVLKIKENTIDTITILSAITLREMIEKECTSEHPILNMQDGKFHMLIIIINCATTIISIDFLETVHWEIFQFFFTYKPVS